MEREYAEDFWKMYFGLIMKDGARMSMGNPAKEFEQQAHMGVYDRLSDEEYHKRRRRAEEIAPFWKEKAKATAGQVFLEALAQTPLSDREMKAITKTLVDASERTYYGEPDAEWFDMEEMDLTEEEYREYQKEHEHDHDDDGFEPADQDIPFEQGEVAWTPKMIYEYLDAFVYGQERAKKAAAIMVYNHLKGRRRNMILAGPTGCGKTEIWRSLQKRFSFIKIINGPQIACDGWKGSYHIKDIFLENPEEADHLLVVVDEADKLFEPAVGSNGTDFSRKLQNEFLKLMDGDTVNFVTEERNETKNLTVNCQNVSFVFCGSFETLLENKHRKPVRLGFSGGAEAEEEDREEVVFTEEDLIEHGNVRREIAGRIQQITDVDQLTEQDFEEILKSKRDISPIHQMEKTYRMRITVDEATRHMLAKKAVESKLGCRYIRSRLQNMLDERIFEAPDQCIVELTMKKAEEKEKSESDESELLLD